MRGQKTDSTRARAWWWTAGSAVLATAALLGISVPGIAQAAYAGSDGLIAFVRHGNIYTINPEAATPSSTVVRLTRGGHDSGPRWSPDGRQLAWESREDGRSVIWMCTFTEEGPEVQRLTPDGASEGSPAWLR
jgi:dipeptidyl aminopeptidase/acylaminoacyl peptidase